MSRLIIAGDATEAATTRTTRGARRPDLLMRVLHSAGMGERAPEHTATSPIDASLPMRVALCRRASQAEKLTQTLGLRAAYRNFGLFFVIHAELVRAFEPGHYFLDPVDIHQERPV